MTCSIVIKILATAIGSQVCGRPKMMSVLRGQTRCQGPENATTEANTGGLVNGLRLLRSVDCFNLFQLRFKWECCSTFAVEP